MRISKDEALRLAVSLDTAISCLEHDSDVGISSRQKQDALICLREIRSHALRVHRDPGAAAEATA